MKKILLAAAVVGSFLFAGSGTALATLVNYTYTDTLVKDLYMNADVTGQTDFGYTYYLSTPLIGTHPAPSPAYVPGTDIFISASLVLTFSDDQTGEATNIRDEKFKIGIDAAAGSTTYDIPDNISNWEFTPSVTTAFSLDGILTYNIKAKKGDFIFNRSVFTATWEYENGIVVTNSEESPIGTTPIPEPATMLLLGTGLVGLAGAARRRKQKLM